MFSDLPLWAEILVMANCAVLFFGLAWLAWITERHEYLWRKDDDE